MKISRMEEIKLHRKITFSHVKNNHVFGICPKKFYTIYTVNNHPLEIILIIFLFDLEEMPFLIISVF